MFDTPTASRGGGVVVDGWHGGWFAGGRSGVRVNGAGCVVRCVATVWSVVGHVVCTGVFVTFGVWVDG